MPCSVGDCTEQFCRYGCLREHESAIRHLVYHITHNANDVDDITQEVLLKAFASISSYRGGSFRAYLARIARNHCYDMSRRKRVRKETSLEESIIDYLPSLEKGPLEEVLDHESTREMYGILGKLGDEDREMMLLRHVFDYSYEEIGEVFGMKAGAIRTRVSRARQRIMGLVEGRSGHESPVIGSGLGLPR